MLRTLLLASLLTTGCARARAPQAPVPPQQSSQRARTIPDIVYAQGAVKGPRRTIPLLLDAYLPAGVGPNPAVVLVHGGGFENGSRREPVFWPELCRTLAAEGYACFSIDYRLMQDDPDTEGADLKLRTVRAAVEDTSAALRWVVAHSVELGVDPHRLALGGGSAGAATALLTAYVDPADAPPVAATLDLWGAMGPRWLDHITADDPPLLIVHGTRDPRVDIEHGRRLAARARQVGLPYTFLPVRGAGHGMPLERWIDDKSLRDHLLDFLDRWVASR